METTKTPARLLVIEDDKNIPMILGDWLKRHSEGMVIDHALTMEDGIKRAPGADCILLDLTIPPIWKPDDSLKVVATHLRPHAPVIILTGYSSGSSESDAKFACDAISEYGADRVFFKSSIVEPGGIGLLFSAVTASMCRRIYERNHPNQ